MSFSSLDGCGQRKRSWATLCDCFALSVFFFSTPEYSFVFLALLMVLIGWYNVAIGSGYVLRCEADDWSGDVLFRVEDLGFSVVKILAGVRGLVLEGFDELVETAGEKGAKDRPNPVDPVVEGELMQDDTRTERAGWIQGATSVINTLSRFSTVP